VTVLDDSYNANPASLKAALEAVSEMDRTGRLVVVLGDMLELGSESGALHAKGGKAIASVAPATLIAVGEHAHEVVAGARKAGMDSDACHACGNWADAFEALIGSLCRGDTVLVKGSRGVLLDRLVQKLADVTPSLA
jgi:UDP-N-acetylmuramoyl-tripeptide--D-alanyl-D-alanine ligase